MLEQKIVNPYIYGLYKEAKKINQLEPIKQDAKFLYNFIQERSDIKPFLEIPFIPFSEKLKLIEGFFVKKIHDTFLNFLNVIGDNKRLGYLPMILEEFLLLCDKYEGIKQVKFYSPFPISKSFEDKVCRWLQEYLNANVNLQVYIDPCLIGGCVIEVGQERLDMSVRSTIQSLLQYIKEEV